MPDTPRDAQPNESSRAWFMLLSEILKDEKLTAGDKQRLYDVAERRFWHRRLMAYIALAGIIVFSAAVVVVPLIPQSCVCTASSSNGEAVPDELGTGEQQQACECPAPEAPDVTWINTTLAAIVVAYYGAAAIKPSS